MSFLLWVIIVWSIHVHTVFGHIYFTVVSPSRSLLVLHVSHPNYWLNPPSNAERSGAVYKEHKNYIQLSHSSV